MLGTLAIAAALTMTMASCSSDKETVENPAQPTQPTQPTTSGVTVTVGAGMATDGAATRSTVANDGNGRVLKFTSGDKLYVYGANNDAHIAGELTMVANSLTDGGLGAQFTGTIKAYDLSSGDEITNYSWGEDPLSGTTATLIHKDINTDAISYTVGNSVTVNYNMYAENVETLMMKCLKVQGDYASGTGYSLSSSDPILNCTISGLTASTAYTFTLKKGSTSANNVTITTGADGTASFAFASMESGSATWSIETKQGNTNVGTISLGSQDFTAKVYSITRLWMNGAFVRSVSGNVNLASINSDVLVLNGATLSGELTNDVKISIADEATVTLNGVTINGTNSGGYQWAGITCEGNAEIILTGNNTVKGFQQDYPGISVPVNKTLTISGTGSLVVSSNGYGCGIGGRSYTQSGNITINGGTIEAWGGNGCAAIGGSRDGTCGDIIITNGTITAYGGSGSAGIGGGHNDGDGYQSTCGNISITGGTVEATGYNNVGIGGGYNGVCGDIIIANTVTQLKASVSNGDIASRPIGKGYGGGTSGTVTIGDIIYFDGSDFQNGGNSYLYHNPFTYHKLYTCNSSDWSSQISAFNAETGVNPILQLISDIPAITETFVISRSNGIIDLNGYTLGKIYLTNNTLNQSITLKNGTVKGDSYYDNAIDGYAGWNDFYSGTIILENLTVQQGIYTDGHEYIIRSGNYQNIYHCTKGSCPGKLVIYGGYFNKTIQKALPSSNAVFGTYELYGGKYAVRPNDSWCASGYSVKSNTDSDSGTYPWIVSAN